MWLLIKLLWQVVKWLYFCGEPTGLLIQTEPWLHVGNCHFYTRLNVDFNITVVFWIKGRGLNWLPYLGTGKVRLERFIYLIFTSCNMELYHLIFPCPELTLISVILDNTGHLKSMRELLLMSMWRELWLLTGKVLILHLVQGRCRTHLHTGSAIDLLITGVIIELQVGRMILIYTVPVVDWWI